jgi:hypothetical protein
MFKKTRIMCVSCHTLFCFGGRSLKKAREGGRKEGKGVVQGWGRKGGRGVVLGWRKEGIQL